MLEDARGCFMEGILAPCLIPTRSRLLQCIDDTTNASADNQCKMIQSQHREIVRWRHLVTGGDRWRSIDIPRP